MATGDFLEKIYFEGMLKVVDDVILIEALQVKGILLTSKYKQFERTLKHLSLLETSDAGILGDKSGFCERKQV
jgi:hypothetical protein